jgi:hypothetical protein
MLDEEDGDDSAWCLQMKLLLTEYCKTQTWAERKSRSREGVVEDTASDSDSDDEGGDGGAGGKRRRQSAGSSASKRASTSSIMSQLRKA